MNLFVSSPFILLKKSHVGHHIIIYFWLVGYVQNYDKLGMSATDHNWFLYSSLYIISNNLQFKVAVR